MIFTSLFLEHCEHNPMAILSNQSALYIDRVHCIQSHVAQVTQRPRVLLARRLVKSLRFRSSFQVIPRFLLFAHHEKTHRALSPCVHTTLSISCRLIGCPLHYTIRSLRFSAFYAPILCHRHTAHPTQYAASLADAVGLEQSLFS